jgi:hypothetical protein
MNYPIQIHHRKKLCLRSCLESAPKRFPLPSSIGGNKKTHPQLHQLKQKLLHAVLEETGGPELFKHFCGVSNQAAELAWATACPLLVFPCLFEELVQTAQADFQSERPKAGLVPTSASGEADPETYPAFSGPRPILVAGLFSTLSQL